MVSGASKGLLVKAVLQHLTGENGAQAVTISHHRTYMSVQYKCVAVHVKPSACHNFISLHSMSMSIHLWNLWISESVLLKDQKDATNHGSGALKV